MGIHYGLGLLLFSFALSAAAEPPETKAPAEKDLTELDLATLMRMDVEVTVASKREQTGGNAAAAVFVLTREDIRRSTAVSLPGLLRQVPGLHIDRADNQSWSLSARGFSSRFANKMLVLIDGRSIYSADFGGVVWEEQNVPLEEIDRIEIVRGPGGALWGLNAVNGVINIITRRAVDGKGLRLTGGGGDASPMQAGIGFGGALRSLGNYHVYAEQFERDALTDQVSPWKHRQLGWRLDGAAGNGQFTFQGRLSEDDFSDYDGAGSGFPTHTRAGNVDANWKGNSFAGGELEVRAYYDWNRRDRSGVLNDTALGIDAQYNAPRFGRHRLTIGTGARYLTDELRLTIPFLFVPDRSHSLQASVYAQDEIQFFADRLQLIAGAKVENYERIGTALQPSLRTLWHANDKHTLWAAASRAARAPSRLERNGLGAMAIPGLTITTLGNPDLGFEELNAYELGWRWRPEQRFSLEANVFQHDYDRLIGTRLSGGAVFDPGPPAQMLLTYERANIDTMRSRGAELTIEAAATQWLRLQASATWLNQHLPPNPVLATSDMDPSRAASLSARIDLPHRVELDLTERFVGERPDAGLEAYYNLDARLGWRPTERLELSLSVDNVFDRQYLEQPNFPGFQSQPFGRTAFARINWEAFR